MHNSNAQNRNTFYNPLIPTDEMYDPTLGFTPSHVQVIFNDQPSAVKEFLTLGWEGDNDWVVTNINTENFEEQINTLQLNQVTREGKHFIPIVSEVPNTYVLDPAGTYTGSDGQTYRGDGTKLKSGIKGFYNNVTLTNSSTEARELFSINTKPVSYTHLTLPTKA